MLLVHAADPFDDVWLAPNTVSVEAADADSTDIVTKVLGRLTRGSS